ncbi:peptidylprolyl isomerase [Cohnella lupini]|uniref:peptidylprolyl isomerase n=1 Tax=Cohnella lupini TaxID=1294267 RepID=A0A3D9HUG3_9BACL|nr:peptidyl-prolyl cis-trans isomerase [Cohnella lupini]RED53070.1 foldase protein PrsA [Cohnella lupini]
MRETIRLFRPLVLLALLTTSVMTSGCMKSDPSASSSPSPTPGGNNPREILDNDEIVATVGEVSISRRQLLDKLISAYGSQTLRSMMLLSAAEEEAKALRIVVSDEELDRELRNMQQGYEDEAQFYAAMNDQLGMNREEVREDARYRLIIEKISINGIVVTEHEIDSYLEEHEEELQPKKQYEWAQIVVETEQQANELLQKLADGDDFGELARNYSLDEFTADDGGKMGWIEDQDPFESPSVLHAIAEMQVGELGGPVPTDEGYVIVRLDGRSQIQTRSEEDIRAEARRLLALGKTVSMRDLEEALLVKYDADVKEPALRP